MIVDNTHLQELLKAAIARTAQPKEEMLEVVLTPQDRAYTIASAIVNLVNNTLLNLDARVGEVEFSKESEKYLGKPGKGTFQTPGTRFYLDSNKFVIDLDYSTLYFCCIRLAGRGSKCFIEKTADGKKYIDAEGKEIDYELLVSILREYEISFDYIQDLRATDWTLTNIQIFHISLPIDEQKVYRISKE